MDITRERHFKAIKNGTVPVDTLEAYYVVCDAKEREVRIRAYWAKHGLGPDCLGVPSADAEAEEAKGKEEDEEEEDAGVEWDWYDPDDELDVEEGEEEEDEEAKEEEEGLDENFAMGNVPSPNPGCSVS